MTGEKETEMHLSSKDDFPKEILWRMYQDNYENARHYETQRSTVMNFIILIAGGIATIVSSGGFAAEDLPLTGLLMALGIFGAVFSSSHYERYKRSKERAKGYLRKLDVILFEKEFLREIKLAVDTDRRLKHPKLDRLHEKAHVHGLWITLPLIVSLLGLVLTVLCLLNVGSSKPSKVVLVDQSGKPLELEQRK